MSMRLYCHPASTTSRTIMMYAVEQQSDLELEIVDILSGEHLKSEFAEINPSQLVPVLEDGEFLLSECSAILKYLADKEGSPIYPKDPKKRARVNEVMDWFNTQFSRDFAYGLVYPQIFPHLKRPSDESQKVTIEWGRANAQRWLTVLDESIIGADQDYLCGQDLTIADYLGAEMVEIGVMVGCELSAWANVSRWLDRMRSRPSWSDTHEVFYGFVQSLRGQEFLRIAGAQA